MDFGVTSPDGKLEAVRNKGGNRANSCYAITIKWLDSFQNVVRVDSCFQDKGTRWSQVWKGGQAFAEIST